MLKPKLLINLYSLVLLGAENLGALISRPYYRAGYTLIFGYATKFAIDSTKDAWKQSYADGKLDFTNLSNTGVLYVVGLYFLVFFTFESGAHRYSTKSRAKNLRRDLLEEEYIKRSILEMNSAPTHKAAGDVLIAAKEVLGSKEP